MFRRDQNLRYPTVCQELFQEMDIAVCEYQLGNRDSIKVQRLSNDGWILGNRVAS